MLARRADVTSGYQALADVVTGSAGRPRREMTTFAD
jgi:hypothetical protein